jgi:hypothetical protein
MQENIKEPVKRPRYSISVTQETYKRLRAAASPGKLASLVDEIIMHTLDNPEISARSISKCRQLRAQP